jgi:cytochrome c oxidase subunit 2
MTYAKRLKAAMFGLAAGGGMPVLAWAEPEVIGRPAVHQLNMQPAVTGIGDYIYSLHNWMMIVCLIIFFAVFGVMFYSVFKHRKSLGHKPATFHESTAVEIAWTVVPFLIVIGMALPATHAVVAMKDTSNPDLTIKVTGMQWKWGYDYLKGEGEGISFLSNLSTPRSAVGEPGVAPTTARTDTYLLEVDNEVVVPVNKKVRLVLTANDVIHSWTIPAFAVKQDAIPGFVRDAWFKAEKVGTYRGNCVACHQASGQGVPNAFASLVGSPVVLGPKAEQINVLLNGKHSGKYPSAMPAWKQLSDTDIASVITYTRNNWTNKADENIVQPSEVLAARGK